MSFHPSRWLLCATLLCSSPAAVAADALILRQPNSPKPMAQSEAVITPEPVPLPPAPEPKKAEITSGKLTLKQAVQKALASSPRLRSAEAGVLASAGEREQAGLWQNPELGVQAENFAGKSHYRGMDSAELTVGFTQTIEIGGKRAGRVAVAEQELALSRIGQTTEKLEVIRETMRAYADAVAAQELLKLTAEQKALAADLHREVRERVASAREPLIQKNKAEITLSTASFAHERAGRELEHAKHVLASQWGEHENRFTLDEKDFFTLTPPLSEGEAEARMEASPDIQRGLANHSRMQARYELEKAEAVPDPRVNLGVRNLRDTGDNALVAGVSIPFPVFNRNQGSVERARQEISKAGSDAEAAKLALFGSLHESLEAQVNAYRHAESLKNSILPAAKEAFKLARVGYGLGRFPYLEVLDAQRTLFDAREQYITALKDYHLAKAEVERLTAQNQKMKEENNAE